MGRDNVKGEEGRERRGREGKRGGKREGKKRGMHPQNGGDEHTSDKLQQILMCFTALRYFHTSRQPLQVSLLYKLSWLAHC